MLYKKNNTDTLDINLFKNPTSEYRGTPFWAWNCKLEKEELFRQIEIFKEMGLGGYHMHVRTGLATPYLSDEYTDIIKSCVEKGKQEGMLSWLYDEDRWPSGAAGGFVTKEEQYRARCMLFTPFSDKKEADTVNDSRAEGGRTGKGRLLAVYDVILDNDGYLKEYHRINENDDAKGTKWYAYLEIHAPSAWYNNQTYVDTLNKKAIERFTQVTHEKYKQTVGSEFGKSIPAIFTDEPQFTRKKLLNNSTDKTDIIIPWTDDIPETYKAEYSCDIYETLPEIFWDIKGRQSLARYRYHDHIAERFASAFADTCGNWCRKNSLALTGHMMEEPSLRSQTAALGDCMRSYRGFDIPGIDMLCNSYELTTAKQCQSATHQYGREAMLSELYGVTGWDFDFRGHKLHGDWQAALGVTVRVPHLSWVSMEGEAKRDYPASISYQSPWYKEYSYIENHFARVNTAMTRGKPVVKVGVIHPIESYWLHWGPNDKSALRRNSMEMNFLNITKWLLNGSVDFDFICESLLPSQCEKGANPLKVGVMEYDTVIVPSCETLRSSTLDRLEKFVNNGGKLIFAGDIPTLQDAEPSGRAKILAEKSICIPFTRADILESVEENRTVTLRLADGNLTENLLYQLRQDNGCRWLFIAHSEDPKDKNLITSDNTAITVKGEYIPEIYDTLDSAVKPARYEYVNGNTVIYKEIFAHDSLLLKLVKGRKECPCVQDTYCLNKTYELPDFVDYSLSEKNVLLLDMCEFKVDNGDYMQCDEILRADNIARSIIGIGKREGGIAQPWVIKDIPPVHTITCKFTVNCEIDVNSPLFAVENSEQSVIKLNGKEISNKAVGWYVDKSIDTVSLPDLKKGTNIIEVTLPLGERTNTEWCYLLGDFGVTVKGRNTYITIKPEKITFGDLTRLGFPFYGGNITYHTEINVINNRFSVKIPHYAGAAVKVTVDGNEHKNIVYMPYEAVFENLANGKHKVDIELFIHRYNSFGPVHNVKTGGYWYGPDSWRSTGADWSYEYVLRTTGIFSKPEIKV